MSESAAARRRTGRGADDEDDDERGRATRERGRRRRRGRRRPSRAAGAAARRGGRGKRTGAAMQASFDHGEEGYGLWLDPAIADDPVYTEHWADHRQVEVTVEPDRIVITRAKSGALADSRRRLGLRRLGSAPRRPPARAARRPPGGAGRGGRGA